MEFNVEEDIRRVLKEQHSEHLFEQAMERFAELYKDDIGIAVIDVIANARRNRELLVKDMIVRFRGIAWTVVYVNESRARICKVGGDEFNRKDCEDCSPYAEFEVLYDPTKDEETSLPFSEPQT